MYETCDSTDVTLNENLDYGFIQESPEPLEQWSLDDFEDLLPERRTLS